jgi:integrase
MADKKRREHGSGTFKKRGDGKYLLRYRIPASGKRINKTIAATNDKAASASLRTWITEVANGGYRDSTITMNRLFDLYEADLKRRERASYENVKLKLTKYLRPRLGEREASSVKRSDILAYTDQRLGEGAENATINRELSYIVRAFTLGIEDGVMNSHPKVTKLDESGNVRLGFVEHETFLALLHALPQHLKFLWVCGYYWGMRKGELCKLRREWARLDEASPIIKIPGTVTKNGKPRTIPIYGELVGWFEMARAEWADSPGCPWIFTYKGKRLKNPKTAFERAVTDAGYPELMFHDLRRTAVRNMERAGVPRAEAMQISGHRTEAVYKRYDIASEKGAIRAGATMDTFFKKLDEDSATNRFSGEVGHKLGTNESVTVRPVSIRTLKLLN